MIPQIASQYHLVTSQNSGHVTPPFKIYRWLPLRMKWEPSPLPGSQSLACLTSSTSSCISFPTICSASNILFLPPPTLDACPPCLECCRPRSFSPITSQLKCHFLSEQLPLTHHYSSRSGGLDHNTSSNLTYVHRSLFAHQLHSQEHKLQEHSLPLLFNAEPMAHRIYVNKHENKYLLCTRYC